MNGVSVHLNGAAVRLAEANIFVALNHLTPLGKKTKLKKIN